MSILEAARKLHSAHVKAVIFRGPGWPSRRHVFKRIVALVILVAMPIEARAGTTGTLRGRVVDAATHAPVAGATGAWVAASTTRPRSVPVVPALASIGMATRMTSATIRLNTCLLDGQPGPLKMTAFTCAECNFLAASRIDI